MEEKQKPKEIVELEEVYGIELKEQIDDNVLIERNHYRLNKNGNVIDISLVKNKIEEIKGFDNFKHLEILDLSMNEITKIENLDNLKNLEILFLGFNNIKKIGNLSNLKNLKVLLYPLIK
jgi:protein phosphatase 1 regulatory subunit 7